MAEPWHFEKLDLKSGLKMQVARAGQDSDKPLIVMLHGFPECWYSWRHQLRALAPHFECVAPDLRGYGGSDAPVGIENYSLDKPIGDVADLIEACGRQRATIMAHDWGGAIAWATALQRPELVERLIVMNCQHLKKFRPHRWTAKSPLLRWSFEGEQDAAPRKELTFGMKELFTGRFEIHYVPDSGRWVQQEKPELVSDYVLKFLTAMMDTVA